MAELVEGVTKLTRANFSSSDCIEDTDASHEDIEKIFGPTVAELVEGVTKLTRANFSTSEQAQMENLRKMFMAMSKDIRVVLIKIADRLHNMRTMQYQTPEKQIKKCKETKRKRAELLMETFEQHYASMQTAITKHLPGADMALIDRAVEYANDKHQFQKRKDGSPYNIHTLAVSKIVRVVLIKIADRLLNMRTMQYQTPEKQIKKCKETMDIYAPLAHRLGGPPAWYAAHQMGAGGPVSAVSGPGRL